MEISVRVRVRVCVRLHMLDHRSVDLKEGRNTEEDTPLSHRYSLCKCDVKGGCKPHPIRENGWAWRCAWWKVGQTVGTVMG